jgi:hypothetical protein
VNPSSRNALLPMSHADISEQDRKPLDPPPIVQVSVPTEQDPQQAFLQHPYLIMTVRLRVCEDPNQPPQEAPTASKSALTGTLVSSLYCLKDSDNRTGGFCIFGDLTVKEPGNYFLEFILMEMRMAERSCVALATHFSPMLVVHDSKHYPGLEESTFITRSFSDQGVRLRLRKDSGRQNTKKRNAQTANLADIERSRRGLNGSLSEDCDIKPDMSLARSHTYPHDGNPMPTGSGRTSVDSHGSGQYYNTHSHNGYENGTNFPYPEDDDRAFKRRRQNAPMMTGQSYSHPGLYHGSFPTTTPRTISSAADTPELPQASFMPQGLPYNLPTLPQTVSQQYEYPRVDTQGSTPQSGPPSAGSMQSPTQNSYSTSPYPSVSPSYPSSIPQHSFPSHGLMDPNGLGMASTPSRHHQQMLPAESRMPVHGSINGSVNGSTNGSTDPIMVYTSPLGMGNPRTSQ